MIKISKIKLIEKHMDGDEKIIPGGDDLFTPRAGDVDNLNSTI